MRIMLFRLRRKNKKCSVRQYLSRASFTVEASVLVPLTVIIIALLLTTVFFVHNRVWYYVAAGEAAIAGNGRSVNTEKNSAVITAEQIVHDRCEQQIFPGNETTGSIETNSWGSTAVFSGGEENTFSSQIFSWSTEVRLKKVRPVPVIRASRGVKQLAESVTGGSSDES